MVMLSVIVICMLMIFWNLLVRFCKNGCSCEGACCRCFVGVFLCVCPCCGCCCKKCVKSAEAERPWIVEKDESYSQRNKKKNPRNKDEERLREMDQEDNSDNIFQEIKIKFLRDFYVRSQKEFELFRTMMNAVSYDQGVLNDV